MIENFANTVIIELISKASSLVFINGGGNIPKHHDIGRFEAIRMDEIGQRETYHTYRWC